MYLGYCISDYRKHMKNSNTINFIIKRNLGTQMFLETENITS